MKFLRCWDPGNLFKKEEKPEPRPASRTQVIDWWRDNEKKRNSVNDKDGKILPWFHGTLFIIFLILNLKALVAHIIADDFLEASIEKKIPTVKI